MEVLYQKLHIPKKKPRPRPDLTEKPIRHGVDTNAFLSLTKLYNNVQIRAHAMSGF